jgi:hypothetical protein
MQYLNVCIHYDICRFIWEIIIRQLINYDHQQKYFACFVMSNMHTLLISLHAKHYLNQAQKSYMYM